eukprot:CAMPEP_0167821146 /NCGR_PEP_ID=MMETSP0112_2-20121227/6595_1 /TAXON_ID=91324 /ORGANISM="Lotharella globosa, Strain CCCM811" /LENGTH=627 /DNA_ID=CAMNT_0007722003 /DNA_START=2278 /DNA_END=4161 /DNA_ORIENTATION=-
MGMRQRMLPSSSPSLSLSSSSPSSSSSLGMSRSSSTSSSLFWRNSIGGLKTASASSSSSAAAAATSSSSSSLSGSSSSLFSLSATRARKRRDHRVRVHIDTDTLQNVLHHVNHVATVASEPVVLPCHRMRCATAQPVTPGLKTEGVALIGAVMLYLISTPGVLAGMIDMYLVSPIQRYLEPNFRYSVDDLEIGKLIAEGGFGEVYRATLIGKKETRDVIVKRAKEFGRPEVWMNERMQRTAPSVIAEYITAFSEDSNPSGSPILLVWNNEGEYTLSRLMAKRDFPINLAPLIFDEKKFAQIKKRNQDDPFQLQLQIYRVLMMQIFDALKACHGTGIVHRDIKPQNFILSARDKRVKLIDLGAAADLRIGINYVPNEFLLDPRYAPPQQYIMSTRTPKAPPAPLAVFLSPVLWQMNYPDRFDIYSAGVSMLQMVFAPLRSDNALIVFNRRLRKEFDYDLDKWRKQEKGRQYDEGFKILDANDGAGWDLLRKLLAYEPKDRPTAAEALNHPFFGASMSPMGALNQAWSTTQKALDNVLESDILLDYIGGRARGLDKIFTEVELKEEFQNEDSAYREAEMEVSNTVRWWEGRNKAMERNKMDATETQLIYKEEVREQLKKKVKKPPRRPV